jgi:uncharacterized membrane protein YfcA
VIELPDIGTFTAALTERRFIAALAIATLAGFLRGFSGFGSALVYIPLISAVYEPRIAAATLLLIDYVCSAPFTVPELRRCHWPEVLPIGIAAVIAVPFGAMALIFVDPIILRWFIAALVLTLLIPLAAGWRYRGTPTLPLTIALGLFAGFGAGAVQIAGPAVILFWLSGGHQAAMVRANLMVFFLFTGTVAFIAYFVGGLVDPMVIALSLLLGVPFFVAMWIGAHGFRRATEEGYRRMAYATIGIAALVSLPVFDRIFR